MEGRDQPSVLRQYLTNEDHLTDTLRYHFSRSLNVHLWGTLALAVNLQVGEDSKTKEDRCCFVLFVLSSPLFESFLVLFSFEIGSLSCCVPPLWHVDNLLKIKVHACRRSNRISVLSFLCINHLSASPRVSP